MADIQDCDETDILEAIELLYTKLLKLPRENLFPSTQPLAPPAAIPGGDYWLTITMGDGRYPLEEQFEEQLREEISIIVTGFSRVQLDEHGRDHNLLKDAKRGLFRIKRKILSIIGSQLALPDGTPIGSDRVYAVHSAAPQFDNSHGKNVGWIAVTFGLSFDWTLPELSDNG